MPWNMILLIAWAYARFFQTFDLQWDFDQCQMFQLSCKNDFRIGLMWISGY